MTDPITPPPELSDEQVGEWLIDDGYPWNPSEQAVITITTSRLKNVARQAFQAGADKELEACCKELEYNFMPDSSSLRAARRPKPLSVKEQALALINLIQGNKKPWDIKDLDVVRRALEDLDD